MTDTYISARFVRDAHAIVRDLLAVDRRRYWTDFLLTIAIAYAAFAVYVLTPPASAAHVAALVTAGFAMYRAVVFTHEIAHRGEAAFRRFRMVWNLLCGIPFLMPSFMYGDHKSHHASHAYGTWADPEYIVHTAARRARIVVFLLLPVVYPLVMAARFLLLTPVALVSRRLDRVIWTYASSLYVMNESYRREYDAAAGARSRWLQEVGCSAWAWIVVGLAIAGSISWNTLAQAYLVFLFWIAVNQVRTLVAHRYASDADHPVSYLDQLLDTNTFPRGRWLPELWAPVGLRYHALHHLLPMLPYHAAREAHGRLMRQLPPDSPYHRTVRSGLWPALRSVLGDRDRPLSRAAVPSTRLADRQGSR
jgi:fatty acid desaturase